MDLQGQNGLMSTYRESARSRGPLAFITAFSLLGFYTGLYFTDFIEPSAQPLLTRLGLDGAMTGYALFGAAAVLAIVSYGLGRGANPPLAQRIGFGVLIVLFGVLVTLACAVSLGPLATRLGLASKWTLYGLLYCIAMVAGAVYYLRKHGNSRYNQVRIAVNVGVQILIAFLLPLVMPLFDQPEYYFSYLWPLDWYKLHPSSLESVPVYLALYALLGSLIAAPLLAYFLGKRWYCSWVCGCGGLANTFGDPYRHLTSKSTASWRFEKFAVHTVLVLAIASTALLGLDYLIGEEHETFRSVIAGGDWWSMKSLYGYVVGSILSGVIGVGLYPLFGPRVWCRNFCPMAAMLGLAQKLGRFRVTVKPDMCISCGNCSTYCEMGIDVRSYAQSNQSFTRASCVGCGMCAHVCPRGVLKLENVGRTQPDKDRVRLPIVDL